MTSAVANSALSLNDTQTNKLELSENMFFHDSAQGINERTNKQTNKQTNEIKEQT